jgi:hypothetical protein
MNITTHTRFSFMLMLTVATATVSTAQDQASTAQINPAPAQRHSVVNDPYSIHSSQQHIALLVVPATRPQVRDWNDSQSAQSPERQTPSIEEASPSDGTIVLPAVCLHTHSHPIAIKYLSTEERNRLFNHYTDQR